MFSIRTVAPAVPLLTLAEAKAAARVHHDDDDAYIQRLIAVAEAYLDAKNGVLGEALVTQTWQTSLSPTEAVNGLRLPIGPVQSVSAVEYFENGTLRPLDAANYRLTDGRVWVEDGGVWPGMDSRPDAMRVTYVAGYGDSASDVPPTVLNIAEGLVVQMYDFPSAGTIKAEAESLGFSSMLHAARAAHGLF